jgi:hypothetical protein
LPQLANFRLSNGGSVGLGDGQIEGLPRYAGGGGGGYGVRPENIEVSLHPGIAQALASISTSRCAARC